MLTGRKLLIATKHEKEKIIAPILESSFGVTCEVVSDFDTDLFGTFAGEVERFYPAIETVRIKCLAAMKKYDYNLAIASEGSFGPHPSLFFTPADEELLILIDNQNHLEITARVLSTETNFAGTEVTTLQDLEAFAERTLFPSHALILKDQQQNFREVIKDIKDPTELTQNFLRLKQKFGKVYVETDMRAHVNPTRKKVIEAATHQLVKKIKSTCPRCQWPGFDIIGAIAGLPCSLCGSPTLGTLKWRYYCKKCQYEEIVLYPHGSKTEQPQFCSYCNP